MSYQVNEEQLGQTKREVFLKPDYKLPGQNYVCLSFISPEDEIRNKNLYFAKHFIHDYLTELLQIKEDILSVTDSSVREKMASERQKRFEDLCSSGYKLSYDELSERFDNFKYTNSNTIEHEYNQENQFRTSTRGIKIRGVFDFRKEAEEHARNLQKTDPDFNIYVGECGHWLPWNPDPHNVEEQEFQNEKLNELAKLHRANKQHVDELYEQRKKESLEDVQRTNQEQKNKNRLSESETKEKLGDLRNLMEERDAWLQAKQAEGKALDKTTSEKTPEELPEEASTNNLLDDLF